jgi:hypothetical protein
MKKRLASGYTFDASAKTLIHADFSDIGLDGIQVITNVTDNIIIYNFADPTKGGTLATDTLTLTFDTTSMDDTDELMILIEDGSASVAINDGGNTITVDGTVGVTGVATAGNQTTIIGHLDGVEGLLTTIDADTGNVSTKIDTVAGAVAGTEMQVDVVGALPAGNNNIGDVDIASIAAGDNNIGNVDIVTIPGVSGTIADNAADSGNPIKVGARYNATQPTYDDGDRADLQVNSRGELITRLYSAAQSIATVATNADAVSTSAVVSRYQVAGLNYIYNGTTFDRQPGDATNGTLVNLGANNDVTVTGDVGVTTTTNTSSDALSNSSVRAISNAAGNLVRYFTLGTVFNGTSWDRQRGDTIGTYVVAKPATTGGMTIFRSLDIDETEEDIKTSAGQVFSISAFNRTAAPLYLKFYNATAASVTVGTTTPVLTFVVPANADSDGAGFIWNNELGFAFATAISVACTTGVADADTGAPGANDCVINVGFA